MTQVAEDKILLRVFTIDSYKSVLISPTLTGDDVEILLRKKMMGTSLEGVTYDDYRLFISVEEGESQPVDPSKLVWDLQKTSSGTVHFIFKIPDQRISVSDYLTSQDPSSPTSTSSTSTSTSSSTSSSSSGSSVISPSSRPKKIHRMRSLSKAKVDKIEKGDKGEKKGSSMLSFDDVSLFRLGNRAGNDQRAVYVRYKDKAPQQFAFQAAWSWDMHMEQLLVFFGLKEESTFGISSTATSSSPVSISQFGLQDKATGAYLSSYADVVSLSTSHESVFSLVSSPLIEVKKSINDISSKIQNGSSVRDGLKVLGSLAKNQVCRFIFKYINIYLFL